MFYIIYIFIIYFSSYQLILQVACGSERSVPHLPEGSSLEVVEKKAGKVVWRVVKDGSLVEEYNEEDIRFTVSCKFHLFRSEQEADQFYTGKGAKLTADSILDGLVRFDSTR